MHPFEYVSVATPDQALVLLKQAPAPPHGVYALASARIMAGGTDLLPLMKEGLARPAHVIDLKGARALRYIAAEADGSVRIGALTTLTDIERHPVVAERFPILVAVVLQAATPQLRNAATVGGNLLQRNRCWYFRSEMRCWLKGGDVCLAREGRNDHHSILGTSGAPCMAVHPSDLAPALVALEAEVHIQGPGGSRLVPLAALLTGPDHDARIEHRLAADELITEIRLPAQPAGATGVYRKVMERATWSFALASVAVQTIIRDGRLEHARLVLGGVAPIPWRAGDAEQLVEGQTMTPPLAAQAADLAVAGATPFSHNVYKVHIARELTHRALMECAGISD